MNSNLESNYQKILTAIDGRASLLAVSKKQPLEKLKVLYELGHRDFGENYAQELVQKAEQMKAQGYDQCRWHFIGHLQKNKINALLPHVSMIHSVDSIKISGDLNKSVSVKK